MTSSAAITAFEWSHQNRKNDKTAQALGADGIPSLNLPAPTSCLGSSGFCEGMCFSIHNVRPVAHAKWRKNMDLLVRLGDDTDKIAEALLDGMRSFLLRGLTAYRYFDAGDCPSEAFRDAMFHLADRLPHCVFYLYTKAVPLFLNVDIPVNMNVVFSLGGRYDRLVPPTAPRSITFFEEDDWLALKALGYVRADGPQGDLPVLRGDDRIAIGWHGRHNQMEPPDRVKMHAVVEAELRRLAGGP